MIDDKIKNGEIYDEFCDDRVFLDSSAQPPEFTEAEVKNLTKIEKDFFAEVDKKLGNK